MASSRDGALLLWPTGSDYLSSWAVGHWVRSPGSVESLWILDRAGSELDKVYPEVPPMAFSTGDTVRAGVRYTGCRRWTIPLGCSGADRHAVAPPPITGDTVDS